MKIYFSHGKKGSPRSTKTVEMMELALNKGYEVEAIDFTSTENPDDRVGILYNILKHKQGDYILVGSSMGAYISLVVSEKISNVPVALFLLAPALYLSGYNLQEFNPVVDSIEIIHGWNDKTVPYQNSISFSAKWKSKLHLLDSDHRLISELDTVLDLFNVFLDKIAMDKKKKHNL